MGLPRTACVFVCGMSIRDDIQLVTLTESHLLSKTATDLSIIQSPMRCCFKPQSKQKKRCLDCDHSRNHALIAFCHKLIRFSTYFNACVIGIPHCDITNFNSPNKQKHPLHSIFDCYVLARCYWRA